MSWRIFVLLQHDSISRSRHWSGVYVAQQVTNICLFETLTAIAIVPGMQGAHAPAAF